MNEGIINIRIATQYYRNYTIDRTSYKGMSNYYTPQHQNDDDDFDDAENDSLWDGEQNVTVRSTTGTAYLVTTVVYAMNCTIVQL